MGIHNTKPTAAQPVASAASPITSPKQTKRIVVVPQIAISTSYNPLEQQPLQPLKTPPSTLEYNETWHNFSISDESTSAKKVVNINQLHKNAVKNMTDIEIINSMIECIDTSLAELESRNKMSKLMLQIQNIRTIAGSIYLQIIKNEVFPI
jgi:hypothetical protein